MKGLAAGHDSGAARWVGALALIAIATGLRELIDPWIGLQYPFLLHYPAVLAASWFLGFLPGLLAVAGSAVLNTYLLLPPRGQMSIAEAPFAWGLALFIVIGVFFASLAESLRRVQARSDQRLREAQEATSILQALMEHVPEGILICDAPDGVVRSVSRRGGELIGAPPERVVGTAWGMVRGSESVLASDGRTPLAEESLPLHRATAHGEVVVNEEVVVRRPDGQAVPLLLDAAPIRDAAGKITGGVAVFREITERKRIEAILQENQARLAALVESSNDAIIGMTPEGVITSWNAAATRMLGYEASEMIGTSIERIVPPERVEDMETIYSRTRRGEPVKHFQTQRRHKDGHLVDVSLTISPIKDGNGRVIGISKTARDITDEKHAVLALRQSEERFRIMADNAPVLIWTSGLDKQRSWFNKPWLDFTGRTMEQEQGNGWIQGVHPDDLERCVETYVTSFDARRPFRMEFRLRRHDGEHRWLLDHGIPLRDAEGTVTGYIGSCIDITDRKQAEQSLADSAERLRLAMQAGRVGVWDWDILTDRITWTPQVYQIHGVAPDQFDGVGVEQYARMIHPEDARRVREEIDAALVGRKPYDVEFRIIRPDGQVRWVSTNAMIFRDSAGKPTRMLGATMDVTQRREAEEERERLLASEQLARAEAERASRMKDEFLATLSHELRTPLNAILGWTQLLSSGLAGADDLTTGLETIGRNARAQAQLVDDLLDMSRIISGKLRLDAQRVDLVPVIEAAIQTVRPAADAKEIELVRRLDPQAGPVWGDPGRLQQVVWNLLSNALKFTPRGGQVEVSLERTNSQVRIAVTDSGAGIRPEFLPHVFERFRQEDASTTRKHGGLGLGLAIVRHLVELHGGTVSAHSAGAGTGARFEVMLPLGPVHPAVGGARRHDGAAVSRIDPASLQGIRVLVVDDEPDARDVLRRLLEAYQARVDAVASAAEALELIRQDRFDVLVSDIGMPEEDGYSFIQKVRQLSDEQGGSIPAAALTALARTEDRTRALRSGFQTHLAKPIEPAELIATVASLAKSGA